MTIGSLFRFMAEGCGEKKAFVGGEGSLTYGDLLDRATRVASALLALDMGAGKRLAVFSSNKPMFLEVYLATGFLGSTFVPFNLRWHDGEIARMLGEVPCDCLVISGEEGPRMRRILAEGGYDGLVIWEDPEEGDEIAYRSLLETSVAPELPYEAEGFDAGLPAALLFTGGTTGRSKGALISHRAFFLESLADSQDEVAYGPSSVFLSSAPLYHRAALYFLKQVLLSGGTYVNLDRFDEEMLVRQVEEEGATAMFVIPPAFFSKVADYMHERGICFPGMRDIVLGGGETDARLIERLFELFPNACLHRGYSHTENAAYSFERIRREDFNRASFDPRGIGRTRPYADIKICDEEGRILPKGSTGEAWGRSLWQMSGYVWGDTPVKDGWIRTGDVLRWNEDGTYSFIGRVKEAIKTGGELVFCSEVEDVVSQMPGVRQCAAFGRPDDVYGERVCVAIVSEVGSHLTEGEVRRFCSDAIAGYKKPREVLFVEEIPLTGIGKVDRARLSRGDW